MNDYYTYEELEIARQKAALFKGYSLGDRVQMLMKAGRIRVDAMPYVLAHLEAAVTEAVEGITSNNWGEAI